MNVLPGLPGSELPTPKTAEERAQPGFVPLINGRPPSDVSRPELEAAFIEMATPRKPEYTVIVGTPSGGSSMDAHHEMIFRLAPYCVMHSIRIIPVRCTGSNIANNQNNIMRAAIEYKADYVLLLENDETIDGDPDFLVRLIRHRKDIVGATYMFKEYDKIRAMGVELDGSNLDWTSLYSRPEVSEVMGLPAGCLLISRRVIDTLAEHTHPWFYHDVIGGTKQVRTTDYVFCGMARKAGFQVWLDAPLSLRIKHWGLFPYQFPPTAPEPVDGAASPE